MDFLEAGKSRFWGNPEFWDLEIWKFGVQEMKKIQILKIQIHSAQNVGKVWISSKKSSRPHLRPFFPWTGKKAKNIYVFAIFLGGPMGPIHPVWALAAIHPRWGNRYCHHVFASSTCQTGQDHTAIDLAVLCVNLECLYGNRC